MGDGDEDPCGSVFEVEAVEIVGERRKVPTVQLICSRPWGHTPANQHSDGVTDWMGDEE